LKQAQKIAGKNIKALMGYLQEEVQLVGIEPSAILTFRDEYPDLVSPALKEPALKLAARTKTFEEFLSAEFEKGNISSDAFTKEEQRIRFHAHCYQKALSDTSLTKKVLEIPVNYSAEEISSGCCGMAGAFGYEKEHYDVSMKIGELVLFPDVRKHKDDVLLAAAGTSCRHQIKDGTDVDAFHPAYILYKALL